uniref:Uncharacterized protein n=1 Tax=Panagrolaimus superbus TaxID=310955 RepID=A0A914Z365_9BILA
MTEHKPILAVKGISATKLSSNLKPSISVSTTSTFENQQTPTMLTTNISSATATTTIGATIGIVSPMRNQEKVAEQQKEEVLEIIETVTMRNECGKIERKDSTKKGDENDDDEIIPMKPLKLTEMPSLRNSRGLCFCD